MIEFLNTTQAAQRLGVGPSTVKRWADDGVLPCVRTAGGHRRFRVADVERFMSGMAGRPDESPQQLAEFDVDGWAERLLGEQELFELQAALLGERGRLGAWWRVAEGLGAVTVELGARWARGQLDIAAEHRATSRLARVLTACIATLPIASNAPHCLLVTVEADQHTLGLSLVEAVAREAGWSCDWIGAPTPTDSALASIASRRPALVAVSASSWSSQAQPLRHYAKTIADSCRAVGAELLLGGSGAWPESPAYGTRLHSLRQLHEELQRVASKVAA